MVHRPRRRNEPPLALEPGAVLPPDGSEDWFRSHSPSYLLPNAPTTVRHASLLDMEHWMAQLPLPLHYVPLSYLAIPGTHDSFTYSLDRTGPIAPDLPENIHRLARSMCCIGKDMLFNWGKTQSLSATAQLKSGIRYFDFRVCSFGDRLRIVHGLYGDEVHTLISEMKGFLSTHPGEVCFFDFQHFYKFEEEHHRKLTMMLQTMLDPYLAPPPERYEDLTLAALRGENTRVIVIYRNSLGVKLYPKLWPSLLAPNPWPNTDDDKKLLRCLDQYLQRRRPDLLFIAQGILTPSFWYILARPLGTIRGTVAHQANKALRKWLPQQRSGQGGVNIVIADFVNERLRTFTDELRPVDEETCPYDTERKAISRSEQDISVYPPPRNTLQRKFGSNPQLPKPQTTKNWFSVAVIQLNLNLLPKFTAGDIASIQSSSVGNNNSGSCSEIIPRPRSRSLSSSRRDSSCIARGRLHEIARSDSLRQQRRKSHPRLSLAGSLHSVSSQASQDKSRRVSASPCEKAKTEGKEMKESQVDDSDRIIFNFDDSMTEKTEPPGTPKVSWKKKVSLSISTLSKKIARKREPEISAVRNTTL